MKSNNKGGVYNSFLVNLDVLAQDYFEKYYFAIYEHYLCSKIIIFMFFFLILSLYNHQTLLCYIRVHLYGVASHLCAIFLWSELFPMFILFITD